MKRVIFIFAILSSILTASAQNKRRNIQVFTVNPGPLKEVQTQHASLFNKNYDWNKINEKLEPIRHVLDADIYLYSFNNKEQRKRFIEKYKLIGVEGFEFNCDDDEVEPTDYVGREKLDIDGNATVLAPDDAVFFVPYFEFKNLEDFLEGGVEGKGIENRDELTIYVPLDSKEEVTIVTKEILTPRGRELSSPFEIHWKYDHVVDSTNANPDIRLGFRPICKEYESDGVFKLIHPTVVDGKNYHNYQVKRMGYDYRKYDPLGKFCDESVLIEEDKNDTIHMKDVIGKKKEGKHYTIDMTLYEMSHDGILKEKSFQVYDGRERIPLKFVEFQINTATFDSLRYIKKGLAAKSADSRDCNLPFGVGSSTLDLSDPVAYEKLKEAITFARDIAFRPEISEQSFSINGFASPEGDYNKNKELAYQRALYLNNQIKAQPNMSGQKIAVSRDSVVVQPWTVVADSMSQCGFEAEASIVRGICQSEKTMEAQYNKIHQLDFYPTIIKDSILPKLRVSRIAAQYTVKRVLPPAEIFQRYDETPEIYTTGNAEAYEYYHLMNRFKEDYDKLEPLAQVAYNKFKDYPGRNDSVLRPWSMAAYHLARCKVKRRVFDEKLLKPYLVKGREPNYPAAWDARTTPPWNYKFPNSPCNEAAVALLQIETLCGIGKYKEADSIFLSCVDNKKYEIVGTFIEVMADPGKLLDNPTAREKMANTSKWNKLVVYSALCGFQENQYRQKCVDEAIKLIRNPDPVVFRDDDPRYHYLRARLMFDRLTDKDPKINMVPLCNEPGQFNVHVSHPQIQKLGSMAGELMKTFMLEENFLTEEMRWDGYFPMGLYEKAKEFWDKNDPTKMRLPDQEFVKKYAKPHAPKAEEANKEEKK